MQGIDHSSRAGHRARLRMPARAGLVQAAATLATAGAGLLVWLALSSALLHGRGAELQRLLAVQTAALALALVLSLLIVPALWQAPRGRAVRYASAAWAAAVAGGVALLALRLQVGPVTAWTGPAAALACLGALAAMGSVPWLCATPPPASSLRLPLQLVLGLLCGAGLLFALVATFWQGPMPAAAPLPSLLLLCAMAAAVLLAHWQTSAGGLRAALATGGAWIVLGLLVLLPCVLALALYLDPRWARAVWPLVALCVLSGAVLERSGAAGR